MPKVRNLRHRVFPPSHGDDKAVARRGKWTDCDSQAGSIPACHIVQFSDRTQLAMTPSDTGRASKSLWRNKVDANQYMRIVRGAGNGPCRVQIPTSDIESSLVNPRSRHRTMALHFS